MDGANPRQLKIRKWIARSPVPASVKGETADGEEREVDVDAKGRYRWADAANAVLDCVKLTALSKDGHVLRVLPLGADPDAELHDEAVPKKKKMEELQEFRALLAIEVPKMLAQVMRSALELGLGIADRVIEGNKDGMSALASVVKLQGTISRESINEVIKLQRALQSGQPVPQDPTDALAMQLLAGAMGGQQAPGAAANGAAGFHISPDMIQAFLKWQSEQSAAEES